MSSTQPRRERLRKLVRQSGAEWMLVSNEQNVTYLTGFTGDSTWLLLPAQSRERELLLSDTRYTTQIAEECPGLAAEIRDNSKSMIDLIEGFAKASKVSKLAIEADNLTMEFAAKLQAKIPQVELVSTSGWTLDLRAVKDADEIAAIRRAIDLAQKTFAVIRASIRPDQTEKQIADAIEAQCRLFGGKCCAFPPIVGVGDRAALPHYSPGNVRVAEHGLLLIDWGVRERLYVSDLTRTLVTARISPKLERVYGVVLKAQLAAIAAIRPGVELKAVDAVAREVIAKAGFDKYFGHGLGHGIGLAVHESPRLSKIAEGTLKAGMVITIEPGIYLPGVGGVRIEDDVLVTRTGHEVLSSVPKEFADAVVG